MTAAITALMVVVLAASGCARYTGNARPIAPAQVQAESGWIVVPPTPTVSQRKLGDCGPAALAMVAGRWQAAIDRESIPVTKEGVRLRVLRDHARAHGLIAYAIEGDRGVLEHEIRSGRPVMIGLLRPYGDRKLAHFEVVIAMRTRGASGEFITIDPGRPKDRGWQVRRWEDLDAEWRPAGRPALVVLGRASHRPP
ncbi:MAG: cysteine peptidase family C39 domain-containing protein [Kofleriaceae bacterium]